jgi:hypothetical protein
LPAPSRSLAKAMRVPAGLTTGLTSWAALLVRFVVPVPSTLTMKISWLLPTKLL